ncbi:MAG: type II toxin-antitoxin system RatA family toxin [Arenicellales bacterium]
MYTINRSALIPYSDQMMFDLINDIEDYQNFLPWCGGSEVLEDTENTRTGSVEIAFKGINKTFTTCNTLSPPSEIALKMIDGPFSKLQGKWTFKALDENACKISLELEFDFANRIVGAVIGPVFKIIADSMLDSFCKRADSLYGQSP